MAEVQELPVGIARQDASTSSPRRDARNGAPPRSVIHNSLRLVLHLSMSILAWPAISVGRLLLGSPGKRIGGYRRIGYPEMDLWMVGGDHKLDQ
jgi:hypothetical protein